MHFVIRNLLVFCSAILVIGALACASSKPTASNPVLDKPLATPPVTTTRPKVIALGDSLTAGFGLTTKESFTYLLQQRLNADGYDYEVVDAGVSGDTSLGGLERSDWVLEQDDAKVLIIEFGGNDLLRGIPVDKMKANLDQIIRKAKAKNMKILLCGMIAPPTMGQKYQQDFSMAFPDLASEHKVAFLPFLLDNVALNKDLNQADGIHPNAEGEKIMTENVYKALKPLL